MFEVKVRRVGNSGTVTIPAPIMRALDIQDGSSLSVDLDGSAVVFSRKGDRQSREEFFQMLDRLGTKNAGILRRLAK